MFGMARKRRDMQLARHCIEERWEAHQMAWVGALEAAQAQVALKRDLCK